MSVFVFIRFHNNTKAFMYVKSNMEMCQVYKVREKN